MTTTVSVQKNDTLYKIVQNNYHTNNKTEIMNIINLIKRENNIKNINIIQAGEELNLPELKLNSVSVFNQTNNTTQNLKSSKNYYRSDEIFGDTATKKNEYATQSFIPSKLNEITKGTKDCIENVVANIKSYFMSDTSRDAKAADIFAKQIGTWTKDGKEVGGGMNLEQTDAYAFAIANNDDFTIRETAYKGNAENHYYFDATKSDNKIILFSLEEINGKEYFTMRDKNNNVHYFDKSDNLKEVQLDTKDNN